VFENLSNENQYAIKITKNKKYPNIWQIKLIKFGDPVSLSRGLAIIENFGFKLLDEQAYKFELDKDRTVFICDFGVGVFTEEKAQKLEDKEILANLEEAIMAVFDRKAENDGLNKLLLLSNLNVREVVMMRAIMHYIIQTTIPFSKVYLIECLCNYPELVGLLYKLFANKFDPIGHDDDIVNGLREQIILGLNEISSLDHDIILRAYLTVLEAMLRTNYFQLSEDNKPKEYLSFKLASAKISFLPKPLPLYEVFVYSLRFEGIHLRGGKVARGGLRWSGRLEDFRTEVLGLVKAQIVKNSVIVPTGSKGGFVCKKLPPSIQREEYMSEAVKCYKQFISGLLDITDNIIKGSIVPPTDVIRYDDNDPYLVVAADKGTSTFSDYANQMSAQYNFWLGDAFASGGSAGYDHKKMGITARGAWESVKRHFRHLGIDTQTQDFTVIGIGDMSGDVFGNGMLLSRHIKLIAAFNHQHIFLDPNPDPAASFAERQRLFTLASSTWADYDITKISHGGGVFDRALKSIKLSEEIKGWLKLTVDAMTPNELIHNILKASADMLYNGGIGTYVKAESESHDVVKDKANDQIRVDGKDLQVKIVVEGGNLGATQLGRIEFAKKDGLIYTDAIDNSAGVDCSDHEVNIKILFADIMQKSNLSVEKRNQVLESMTDDVSKLVLRDNYLQTEVLQYAFARASELFSINMNFIEKLEKNGELDREIEFLPNHVETIERQRVGKGLTLPEIAVLLSYSKIYLTQQLLLSDIILEQSFEELLVNYFPRTLQEEYTDYIHNHYLRKEIIASQLANLIVNRMGVTFISRFEDEFRIPPAMIVCAFWAVYKVIDAAKIFDQIEVLDSKVPADIQIDMLIRFKKSLERLTRLVLRKIKDQSTIYSSVTKYHTDIAKLMQILPEILNNRDYHNVSAVEASLLLCGANSDLAVIIARSNYIPQLLDIVVLADETKYNLEALARNYFYAGRRLRFDWLRSNLIALPENNKWQSLSRSALLADGYALYSLLIKAALQSVNYNDDRFIETWISKEPQKITTIDEMFDELKGYKILDLSMLSAMIRELHRILS
jgi:glutamate dehydrogenase